MDQVKIYRMADNKNDLPIYIRKYDLHEGAPVMHMHDSIQINYVLRGSLRHTINKTTYDLVKGDIFIIPPFVPHGLADKDKGDFDEWVIYKADGKTLAVEGVDYKIVKGSLTAEKLVIRPLKGVIICGNYDGVTTKPIVVKPDEEKDDSNKAPQTSDNLATALSVVMIAALGVAVVAKKKIAE